MIAAPKEAQACPNPDERAGMDWWNSLSRAECMAWLGRAGSDPARGEARSPAEAWAAYKLQVQRSQRRPDRLAQPEGPWREGYRAGETGQHYSACPYGGADGWAWCSGFIEGKGARHAAAS